MAVSTKSKAAKAVDDGTWQKNATFPQRPAELAGGLPLEAWLEHGMRHQRSVELIGPHGIGKTSAVKAFFNDRKIPTVYMNLANISPGDKLASALVRREDGTLALGQLLSEELQVHDQFALLLDDSHHASAKVGNTFMQVVANWGLGQFDLTDKCVAVVLMNNEGAAEGIRHGFDPAQADRKVTVVLKHNDTGWRYALARKYSTIDLSDVFQVWDSLTPELRHVLSPRALDHVIYVTSKGLPPLWALPIMGDQRQRLVNAAGTDRTEEVLTNISRALGRPYVESVSDPVEKILELTFADRLTVLLMGPPGCGKTESVKAAIKAAGLDSIYFSMPITEPEMLQVPMPTGHGTMRSLLDQRFLSDKPYGIVWDEYNRPMSQASFACLMEATQEYSMAGVDLENCRGQIALANPSEWMGLRMNVAKNNMAQADRFTISVQLTPEDIKANTWLLTKWPHLDHVSHGDAERASAARGVMEAVLEWHKEDLGPEHSGWITKRTLQRIAELALDGLPVENAKIYIGEGEFAPVPMADLLMRLQSKQVTRLKDICQNIDHWVSMLEVSSEVSEVGTNDTDTVHTALTLAETPQLWENFEQVARLLKVMPKAYKVTYFMGGDKSRTKVFSDALNVAFGHRALEDITVPEEYRRP